MTDHIKRRSFLGVLVAPFVARLLPAWKPATTPPICRIDSVTEIFWRNSKFADLPIVANEYCSPDVVYVLTMDGPFRSVGGTFENLTI